MRVNNLLTGFRWRDKYKVVPVPTSDGYAVPFTLTYLPGTNPYFLDIQPAIGDQLLPFWIEHAAGVDYTSNTPFTSPKIWVRLPNGCTEIDMYRGNRRITTDRSDGSRTFIFFDDFNSAALDTSKWSTTITGGSTITTTNNYVNIVCGTGGTGVYAKMGTVPSFGTNVAVRSLSMASYFGNVKHYSFYGFASDRVCTDPFALAMFSYDGAYGGKYYNYVSGDNLNTITGVTGGSWFIYDEIRNSTTSNIYKINDSNTVTATSQVPTGNLYICMNSQCASGGGAVGQYHDWILVRKYQSPEPTPILVRQAERNPYWRGG